MKIEVRLNLNSKEGDWMEGVDLGGEKFCILDLSFNFCVIRFNFM